MTDYGRPNYVPQAVYSFLQQDYENKELIILNSCPRIKYSICEKYKNIKIINLEERPVNYAKCFDLGVMESIGDFIVPFDSDDIYLKNYLSTYINNMQNDIHWIRQNGHFVSGNILNDNKFQSFKKQCCVHTIIYSRQSYDKIGGYQKCLNNAMQSNKIDKLFTSEIQKYKGKFIDVEKNECSFVYRFFGIPAHYSMYGETDSYRIVEKKINKMLDDKVIKSGDIQITPKWHFDYYEARENTI